MQLEVSDLEVRLPGRAEPLFRIPSLTIASGSRVVIHGPSGSGKTTFLNVLCGQFLPDAGSIVARENEGAEGTELTGLSEVARTRFRRENFGLIFQRGNLVEHLTVRENILLGMSPEGQANDPLMILARTLGLEGLLNTRAGLLSPGEQQRVAVARIRAGSPRIVMADEPTSSLDGPRAEAVLDALWEASEGKTLVVVSHDVRVLSRFDTVYDFRDVMAGGRV